MANTQQSNGVELQLLPLRDTSVSDTASHQKGIESTGNTLSSGLSTISMLEHASSPHSEAPAMAQEKLIVALSSSEEISITQESSGVASTQIISASLPISKASAHLANVAFASIELLSPWWPIVDPNNKRAKTWRTWKSGREVALWISFTVIFLVFTINLALTCLAWIHFPASTPDQYIRNLYSGNCTTVRRADTGAHFVINLLSTLMLWASNACLQLTVAPSREEVNKAHKQGTWLDIGVPSLRNLHFIPLWSRIIWCILACSSLPVHFLYNSTVFSSTTLNWYAAIVVTEDFFQVPFTNDSITGTGPIIQESLTYNLTYGSYSDNSDNGGIAEEGKRPFGAIVDKLIGDHSSNPQYFRTVPVLEGLQTYSHPFTWRPNLFAITSDNNISNLLPNGPDCTTFPCQIEANSNNASFLNWQLYNPFSFVGGGLCEFTNPNLRAPCSHLSTWNEVDARAWTMGDPFGYHIDHFLLNPIAITESAISQEQCHLQCSPAILLAVTLFNLCKCVCILCVIFASKTARLCTLGDAIASFLEFPDQYTKAFGVTSIHSISKVDKENLTKKGHPSKWDPKPMSWWRASSVRRTVLVIIAFLSVIILASVEVGQEIYIQKEYNRSTSLSGLWSLGFGAANFAELISWNQPSEGVTGLFVNILIANIWQVLVSTLYVAFNTIFNCQLLAHEWAGFAKERKPLRMSSPRGIQRSTYFISMPLRYGIPISAVFTIIHWLLSQSTFIIRVLVFDWDGTPLPGRTMTGFSIMPSMFSLIISMLCFTIYIFIIFLRKYPDESAMPFVSTCSLAISANCHRPEDDKDAHLFPVMWGVYEENNETGAKCSFTTTRYIRQPEKMEKVFGLPEHEYIKKEKTARNVADDSSRLLPDDFQESSRQEQV